MSQENKNKEVPNLYTNRHNSPLRNGSGSPHQNPQSPNAPNNENYCAICHRSPMINQARLDTCHHEFCSTCILNWSQQHNQCPLCRTVYHRVINVSTGNAYIQIPHRPEQVQTQIVRGPPLRYRGRRVEIFAHDPQGQPPPLREDPVEDDEGDFEDQIPEVPLLQPAQEVPVNPIREPERIPIIHVNVPNVPTNEVVVERQPQALEVAEVGRNTRLNRFLRGVRRRVPEQEDTCFLLILFMPLICLIAMALLSSFFHSDNCKRCQR